MDTNTEMYAKLVGLYFMGLEIPQEVKDWVCSHTAPNDNIDITLVGRMICGSPDTSDVLLKSMIKSLL